MQIQLFPWRSWWSGRRTRAWLAGRRRRCSSLPSMQSSFKTWEECLTVSQIKLKLVACWTFTLSSSALWITEPDWIPSSCRNATGTMTVEEESSWVKFSFKVIPSWNLLSSHQCLTLLLTIFLKAESWCATNQCFVLNEPVALPSCGNRATFTA